MPCSRSIGDLGFEGDGVDDHPVAHHVQDAFVQDAGRDEVEDEGLAVGLDGVAGVVAAVVARHYLHLVGEEVDDLAFAFVAPLGADDHDVGHVRSGRCDGDFGRLRRGSWAPRVSEDSTGEAWRRQGGGAC